ncbi:ISL3 family transposase [Haploplasma axanthum]|uniref:Transposase and inactivated derivatives n=1 Tax=Haploplasma axanthum TaxID=29552 RepID=A0A449BCE4_HAPAX|nr:ISL3 family transposase [Haploplasma axanthum]VEU80119.1 Transposase and inactivated derivatives [Haploplasma axanthum]
MYKYFIKKLLGFKDNESILINKLSYEGANMFVNISLEVKEHNCPSCNSKTSNVHDYRTRKFKHGVVNNYFLHVIYNRRRYVCKYCNTRFPENNFFIDKYSKISNQLNNMLIHSMKDSVTFKQVAKNNNVSSSTVIRRFDKHFSINQYKLSSVISIDEFKKSNSNSKFGKYALAIADPINKSIIDIIPNRRKDPFISYLDSIPFSELNTVNTVIIDMWPPYRDVSKKYFPNAKLVIDRFHFVRNFVWALNDIRIRTMNSYKPNSSGYKVLKKFHKLLIKNHFNLSYMFSYNKHFKKFMSEYTIVRDIISYGDDLTNAYNLYSYFQVSTNTPFDSFDDAMSFIDDFINKLYASKLPEFISLAGMFINWKVEIANSLCLTYLDSNNNIKFYSNGFIEGVNNFIKTTRRMSYNFRSFNRFKKRIISLFNNDFCIIA